MSHHVPDFFISHPQKNRCKLNDNDHYSGLNVTLSYVSIQIDRLWKDRLDHPIVNSEITKFMDKKWMVKEQTEINQS